MKKLFFIAPAFLLFACNGGNESAMDDLEQNIETVIEDQAVTTEELEESLPTDTDEEIQNYLEEKGWEGEKLESGMYIVIDESGKGDARPKLSDEVTIFYQGYLLDGFKFDGTGESPATFPLMNLIQGWQIGIPQFGKGGKGKLIIPANLAYGDMDRGEIPGGSTLMFEIELIDWLSAQ